MTPIAKLRRRVLVALPLAIISTFALATLALSYLPRTRAWSHGIARADDAKALVSSSYGITIVVHEPRRVNLIFFRGTEPEGRAGLATVHGVLLEEALPERSMPGWARGGHDPAFPKRCVAGLPLRCFRVAATRPPEAATAPLPPHSIEFRGAIAIGSPAIAYGRPSRGVLIPYAIRPLRFVADVAVLTLAWALLMGAFARTWRLGARLLRARRGRCPTCGYDLAGVPSATCPECGRDVGHRDTTI